MGLQINDLERSANRVINVPETKSLKRRGKFSTGDFYGYLLFLFCALILVAGIVSIFGFVTQTGILTFTSDHQSIWEFLTSSNWKPNPDDPADTHIGALWFIIGSLSVTLLGTLIATPIAIGAALFMVHVAPRLGARILRPAIELFVGIPSVVYGLFGLLVIVRALARWSHTPGFGILAGGLVLSLMILPTITSVYTDTLRQLPPDLKEASYALGSTRWQTISQVLIPASTAGLLTAIILGVARAIGEALAVKLVVGNGLEFPHGWFDTMPTLTGVMTQDMPETTPGTVHSHVLFSIAMLLLIFSFAFVLLTNWIGSIFTYNPAKKVKKQSLFMEKIYAGLEYIGTATLILLTFLGLLAFLWKAEFYNGTTILILATILIALRLVYYGVGKIFQGNKKVALGIDKIMTGLIWANALIIVAALLYMIVYILRQGLPYLSWKFITDISSNGAAVGPEFFNSIYLLFLTLLFSLPLGLGAGIYLAEYAHDNFLTRAIRFSAETLAAVPSIVMGLFGLLAFVYGPKIFFGTNWSYSLLGGALSLTLLNLPVMTRVSEVAIRGVDKSLREASYGLGATKWQTVGKVLIPGALPGLTTGLILISGRIFGEAAALLFTSGVSGDPISPFQVDSLAKLAHLFNPIRSGATLSVNLYFLQTEGAGPNSTEIVLGSAALLVLIVLVFNISARILGTQIYRRLTAGR